MFTTLETNQLLASFSTIFFVLAVGFGVQRLHPFKDESLQQLSWLVVDILLPLYLFYATATGTTPEALIAAPFLIIAGLVIPLVSLFLAYCTSGLIGVKRQQQPVYHFSAMVGNTAFLGIPICASLFGVTGAIYAVLYDFGTTLIVWTLGIWILRGGHRTDWRGLAGNPFIWSVVMGLVFASTGWILPEFISRPISTLGSATLPLALLVVGAQLGNIRTSNRNPWPQVMLLAAIRLVATPLIIAAAMYIFTPAPLLARVVVIEAAMPVGLITAIMARRYGLDADLPAAAIFWSTLALIVTLPILVIFLL